MKTDRAKGTSRADVEKKTLLTIYLKNKNSRKKELKKLVPLKLRKEEKWQTFIQYPILN